MFSALYEELGNLDLPVVAAMSLVCRLADVECVSCARLS